MNKIRSSMIFSGRGKILKQSMLAFFAVASLASCGSDTGSSSGSSSSSSSGSSTSSSSSGNIPSGSTSVFAVNAGGSALTVGGVAYVADRFYSAGNANPTTNAIAGTEADGLYQSERYGTFSYDVPVTNSTYSVKLHFAELYQTASQSRYFSLVVEGQQVFVDKDLYDEVGSATALDIVVRNVTVADEGLTIELTASLDNATISGFAIYSNNGGQLREPPVSEGCDLPSNLSWTSTSAIIQPKNGASNIKDPSIVYYDNKYHVFATTYTSGSYRSIYLNFSDFSQASSANHVSFSPGGSSTVAPQVFYFSPQNKWYIVTQWNAKYTTSSNISDPNSWSSPQGFWPGASSDHGEALDYWVICDDNNCYLYFYKDDGKMYYVKTPINNFPNFDINQVVTANVSGSGDRSILFEAGNIYKIKGSDEYLLMVEGWGSAESRRFYRAWTSTSLDGPWQDYKTSENSPFAGINNVTFPNGQWSQQISHGEMVRSGYDEKMELDTCNMKFLYQGVDLSGYSGSYDARPYKLGLLEAN